MKEQDPTIAEVREARHRISEAVAHDPRKLVEYYRRLQERHRERVITQATVPSEKRAEDAA
jgi:hypothetical protein